MMLLVSVVPLSTSSILSAESPVRFFVSKSSPFNPETDEVKSLELVPVPLFVIEDKSPISSPNNDLASILSTPTDDLNSSNNPAPKSLDDFSASGLLSSRPCL